MWLNLGPTNISGQNGYKPHFGKKEDPKIALILGTTKFHIEE